MAGGQQNDYLNKGKLLNLIIKIGENQKRIHAVVAAHVAVLLTMQKIDGSDFESLILLLSSTNTLSFNTWIEINKK